MTLRIKKSKNGAWYAGMPTAPSMGADGISRKGENYFFSQYPFSVAHFSVMAKISLKALSSK